MISLTLFLFFGEIQSVCELPQNIFMPIHSIDQKRGIGKPGNRCENAAVFGFYPESRKNQGLPQESIEKPMGVTAYLGILVVRQDFP